MKPKYVIIPSAIKSLTGNTELITELNRFGCSISYSKILEIDTQVAINKLAGEQEFSTALLNMINMSVFTTLVWKNIDLCRHSLRRRYISLSKWYSHSEDTFWSNATEVAFKYGAMF